MAVLFKNRKFGANTSPIENVLSDAVERRLWGQAREVLRRQIKDGIIGTKPSGGRKHIFLTAAGRRMASLVC